MSQHHGPDRHPLAVRQRLVSTRRVTQTRAERGADKRGSWTESIFKNTLHSEPPGAPAGRRGSPRGGAQNGGASTLSLIVPAKSRLCAAQSDPACIFPRGVSHRLGFGAETLCGLLSGFVEGAFGDHALCASPELARLALCLGQKTVGAPAAIPLACPAMLMRASSHACSPSKVLAP